MTIRFSMCRLRFSGIAMRIFRGRVVGVSAETAFVGHLRESFLAEFAFVATEQSVEPTIVVMVELLAFGRCQCKHLL